MKMLHDLSKLSPEVIREGLAAIRATVHVMGYGYCEPFQRTGVRALVREQERQREEARWCRK